MKIIDLFDLNEGKTYSLDGGYTVPVMVINNPSPPQARTLAEKARRGRKDVYLRGLMYMEKVYVWEGYMLTHDDVRSQLFPEIDGHSSDLTTFTLQNYKVVGLRELEFHLARCIVEKPGDYDPITNRFVKNVLEAINAVTDKIV
jgi:hypothetical protein